MCCVTVAPSLRNRFSVSVAINALPTNRERELASVSTKLKEEEDILKEVRAELERRSRSEETTQQQLNQTVKQVSQLEPKLVSMQSEVKKIDVSW